MLFTPIVSADWLAQHLEDPNVTIADCRFSLADPNLGQQQYQTAHIPGAYYFDLNQDLSSPVGERGGRHPLPNPDALGAKLARSGVNSSGSMEGNQASIVVAYDDSRFAFAARFWWLLRYLGHDRVAVLDGGFGNWQAAGYPVSDAVPTPRSGQFLPLVRSMAVDIAAVKARKDLPQVVLVDSREAERYRGEREPIDPIAGHIPGAVNYPWQDVTDSAGFFRSPAEQQQRWAAVHPADEVIVYCGSGVTACVNVLSLEAAGVSTGKLYAGSWSDWCADLINQNEAEV